MNRALIVALIALSGCTPRLTTRAARVTATRVLAVRAEPAEARPGARVTWRAVVASPEGAVSEAPIDWRFCLVPRAADESTTIAAACLGDGMLADGGAGVLPLAMNSAVTVTDVIPSDACARVGPQVPVVGAGMTRQRAPDPDVTGGYQLPLRLTLDDDTTFARQRLRCNLPDAPVDVAREFQQRYHDNQNPALSEVRLGGDTLLSETPTRVARGATLVLSAAWPDGTAEDYVMVDPVTREVAPRRERLEIGWFTNGGTFAQDRTGTDEDPTRSFNTLTLDADRAEPVTVWVVLRDDRGGVDARVAVLQPE